ncbi:Uncharacterised protein (plasmid) [Tsukamurella tyrosinosolvens]|uniref:Uncharacterized protein n=1 Tax=Tsukamurella tyrosinosolvens TaxID=57704 RepID=A0A1H4U1C5_TSUTY|nr:hypothetical protein [Tsukamurella tyrosinosolvens]KXO93041.1 hypothetical protein AXK58_14315 [Tsukamurella tyrosinosolvens]SEC62525.1 hypothetical protein SAMN04489793_2766 [Tsukamurella tyrosinosolvens]VEH93957.1 Uncharacterised protein [Tsukamurella tyrosinosolvens]
MSYSWKVESGLLRPTYIVGSYHNGTWQEHSRYHDQEDADAVVSRLNGGNFESSREAAEHAERLQRERRQAAADEAAAQAASASAWQRAQQQATDHRVAAEEQARRRAAQEDADLRAQYPPRRTELAGGLADWDGVIWWTVPGTGEVADVSIADL